MAQSAPTVSRPVVQTLPTGNSQRLNAALARVGRNPRDASALADAGDAAREMGDFEAAVGFYRRADQLSANNLRVKSGLARALVASGKAVEAIAAFDAAEKAGASARDTAADRGLAYDLVGDNARAQQYYNQTLNGPDAGLVRQRLALSQAIAGDGKTAEATLMPLLRQQDKPAWRARAFALAIGGDTKQAVEVATSILPQQLAQGIAPYLRYMPRLTRAQQAAAANLGIFPRASEIGRDDGDILAYVAAHPPLVRVDAALVPRGKPLGEGGNTARRSSSRDNARVAPPDPRPTIEGGEAPPAQPAAAAKPAKKGASASPAKPASPPVRTAAASPAADPAPVATGPSGAAGANSPAPMQSAPASAGAVSGGLTSTPSSPATSSPATPPAERTLSLAEIFADIGAPTTQPTPAVGAVDITKVEPARPAPPAPKAAEPEVRTASKPEPAKPDSKKDAAAQKEVEAKKAATAKKPSKSEPPAHPSRIWVQIGVGRDKGAIVFDWRRWNKQAPALFKGRDPHIADKGGTNRILAGPFGNQKDAASFAADVKKAGISDAFVWTSPAGQVVDALPVK